MMSVKIKTASLIVAATSLLFSSAAFAQKDNGEATATGTPVLWQEPTDIASRDLYLGPGGESMKPDLSHVTFVKEETHGYSTKYRVLDGAGNEWVVKIGKEAQSDTVASRLLWAVGYTSEISYLVPRLTIDGKGTFENARFEARPKDVVRMSEWSWDNNPFRGTREFQGLKVMMILINNWDIKDSNNKIIMVQNKNNGRIEARYIISDLGGSLGKTAGFMSRTRNKPSDFVKARFIDGVKAGYVDFNYNGKHQSLFRDITLEQSEWIGQWLSRLSEQQLADAFRAGNYTASEVDALTQAMKARIQELAGLSGRRMAGRN
jgi:hypothetical protein